MPRSLKVYTLGIYGFVSAAVRNALGLPSHVQQARVLVVAPTKVEAIRILHERGFRYVNPRGSEFRLASGNDMDALTAAGHLVEPGVWVMPPTGSRGSGVVVIQPGGTPVRIGRLDGEPGFGRCAFVPEPAHAARQALAGEETD